MAAMYETGHHLFDEMPITSSGKKLVMGQAESAEDQSVRATSNSTSTGNAAEPSLDSLIAEAAAYGNEANDESLEAKAQKALECPCIDHLRSGPCGSQFSNAFVCFFKSTAEEKGSDCVHPFVALQNCIKANPGAFSDDVLDDNDAKEEKPSPQKKIRPPLWS
ncbi:mitochondrial intermembrane space import and assembly protein 40 homolog [Andrographis paniculata]|uniref:mitochondrial intermembrane space import and assembly protein 40 homolog n=1 Tax=Andrographis paniculata TaxID=175694 RepID=UPI0021E9A224|nr:mitochondrial intermembrane space import and assembly protein 40 homolog [Andrographis paniculata]